ncbi:phosphonate C-P lyase system protein PhnH [Halomonas borealis]|uniref:phosphonate C-P lyase system protein PhnH n=1 Tax=Halomonas borealis TaxID=2508710 RepID=UPI0010A0288F|nr:phosphonate C-P lyase system protein PhnH [Halomonas borealis]
MRWQAFSDPVQDGQRHFRQVLAAMAEPGTLHDAAAPAVPEDAAIAPALWATLLSLCDLDTSLWIAPGLEAGGLADAVTFHTGCRLASAPDEADFALVTPGVLAGPGRDSTPAFAEGSDAYPDRGSTLLVVLDTLAEGGHWRLAGPGIPDSRDLDVGEATPLMTRLAANQVRFPRGLDAILGCGERLVAIPRSTRIEASVSATPEEDRACTSQ